MTTVNVELQFYTLSKSFKKFLRSNIETDTTFPLWIYFMHFFKRRILIPVFVHCQ